MAHWRAVAPQERKMMVPALVYVCDSRIVMKEHKRIIYKKKKLRGLSPRANYTDRAAAAGRRS